MSELSTILFARSSFAEGMGRLLDVGGTLTEYNTSPTDALADYYALYADWWQAHADLEKAICKYESCVASQLREQAYREAEGIASSCRAALPKDVRSEIADYLRSFEELYRSHCEALKACNLRNRHGDR